MKLRFNICSLLNFKTDSFCRNEPKYEWHTMKRCRMSAKVKITPLLTAEYIYASCNAEKVILHFVDKLVGKLALFSLPARNSTL